MKRGYHSNVYYIMYINIPPFPCNANTASRAKPWTTYCNDSNVRTK